MMTSPLTSTRMPSVSAPPVRRWLRIPATGALLALTAGWILGALVQTRRYSSIDSTISDLAATWAPHRIIMTTGLFLAGGCLVLLAAASGRQSPASRIVLGIAGVGVLVVAAAPLPANGQLHSAGAVLAFGCLTLWPAFGFRIGDTTGVRATMAILVTSVNLVFFLWVELAPGLYQGFAERALATASLLWVVVQTFEDTSRPRG